MWSDIDAFGRNIPSYYRRDVWAQQERYCEVVVEKDALSGIFEDVLEPYGVTLAVSRGFDSWSAAKDMAARLKQRATPDEPAMIFHFTDFDPSGEDMVRALRNKLEWFEVDFEIQKAALTRDDIEDYALPPNFTKATDSRAARHIAEHGDISVELDALPVGVLRARLVACVEGVMDLTALAETRRREEEERAEIARRWGVEKDNSNGQK
jgi:hypothetical protein